SLRSGGSLLMATAPSPPRSRPAIKTATLRSRTAETRYEHPVGGGGSGQRTAADRLQRAGAGRAGHASRPTIRGAFKPPGGRRTSPGAVADGRAHPATLAVRT